MIRQEIVKLIKKATGAKNVHLERPENPIHGDYSTNIALQVKRNPDEIIKKLKLPLFQKVERAGPGFINFFLFREVFLDNLKQILKQKDNFGKNQNLKNKKIIIEYTDPNPFKEFHIGHLMSNSIGESLSRILEFQGAEIKRANYQGDVGLHVANALIEEVERDRASRPLKIGISGISDTSMAYPVSYERYKNDEEFRERVDELNKIIYSRSDERVNRIYDLKRKQFLDYFEAIYKKLGTKFDYYLFESEVSILGKKIVEDGLEKGIFERGEKGAIIFKGEQYGLHTRVFVNSEGLSTYEAKELGLAKSKYDKYKYDKSIIVTGNEVNEYFKVMLCVMAQIFPELVKKIQHIGHGMMRLPRGKISSRTGEVITFESLLNQVQKLIFEKIKNRDLSATQKNEIPEKVAIGALKYSILKQSIGSDIIYDFEKSISFEGDSGPYLQYSYVRAQSVLRKAKTEKIKASLKNSPQEINQLGKMMLYFPEIVEKAGKDYEPHFIALYLTDLSREFNNYYEKNKIVDKKDEFSPYKVVLTEAFSIIMKNGLWLLGISAPEKM